MSDPKPRRDDESGITYIERRPRLHLTQEEDELIQAKAKEQGMTRAQWMEDWVRAALSEAL